VTGTPATAQAAAVLSLRVARGYPATVLIAALFVALVLTAGLERLHELSAATEAAAAILLTLPTLFIALIAGPARRSPAVKLVTVARGVLLLSGLLTYVGAMALIMYPSPGRAGADPTLHAIWYVAAYTAWGLVGLQTIGVVGPLIQARRRST